MEHMAYRLVRSLVYKRGVGIRETDWVVGFGLERRIQLGWIFFFTPSRVVAASCCMEFWMAALVVLSHLGERLRRIFGKRVFY